MVGCYISVNQLIRNIFNVYIILFSRAVAGGPVGELRGDGRQDQGVPQEVVNTFFRHFNVGISESYTIESRSGNINYLNKHIYLLLTGVLAHYLEILN